VNHSTRIAQFLSSCAAIIGAQHVISDAADMLPFLTDWRRRQIGHAIAVLLPQQSNEVAALVRLCRTYQIAVVPQGGNTGLVLGSIPTADGNAVVISLKRLNQIRTIDIINNTATVEAGCLLATLQDAVQEAGRNFPLSLASEGSCTIGGNLSTNAGGTAVLRYGNARELCLGLEVVTAQGEIWNGLRTLRKDNTGYDLRDLFIGAEGTLGIITAAVLKLYPLAKSTATALVAVSSPAEAVQLLNLAQTHCGADLSTFELISQFCVRLVQKHFLQTPNWFQTPHPYFVLIELSSHTSLDSAQHALELLLSEASEIQLARDAVIASSEAQRRALWALRENISEAQAAEGKNIKHDISLPISELPQFIVNTDALLQKASPACRMVTFGHLGDGNLHYNVSPPEHLDAEIFLTEQANINRLVHDQVHQHGGSISAEHGLGALKREEILRYKSPLEMQLMRAIKQALDPDNLMNPGKVL
jgi:D-lactate dehydrogenase (cytochrome)